DYQRANKTGKPAGIDIRDKKMTLPLIYLLNKSDRSTKRRIINIIKNHNTDPDRVAELIREVTESGGIDYAKKKMMEFRDEAIEILESFPQSPAKKAMVELVRYTTDREK
ncbi:MAG TPA: polyprenyl synthetase family protein, partial [Bacteroidales bacterium]|nr:polyprenyl synthetase family protein [Bacteroidales bacterium]